MAKPTKPRSKAKPISHTLICGTDFSENCRQAADTAAALASRMGLPLTLIHVIEGGGLEAGGNELPQTITKPERERLQLEADRLAASGAKLETRVLGGSPYETLVMQAQVHNAPMLIVSSVVRRAPERWLIGSVAERTAETATVPTLVVRDAQRLQRWISGKKPLKVFIGTDFTVSSRAALSWIKELEKIGPCEVTLAYVDWPPEEHRRLGLTGRISLVENPPEVQEVLERELLERAAEVLGREKVRVRVAPGWGRVGTRLTRMAAEEDADLIVVGTHQREGMSRFWLGSVSRDILRHSPMNIAVVPMTAMRGGETPRIPETRRTLVATDFSEAGNWAVPQAYSMLTQGGVVRLIHVMEPFVPPGPTVPHYQRKGATRREHLNQKAAALAQLRRLAPMEAVARGIETQVEVIESKNVPEAICQAAERFGAQIICMGARQRGSVSKAIVGSVADEVVRHARRPIMLVRPPEL